MKSPKAAQQESHSSIGNVIVLVFLLLPEIIMSFFLWASNLPHKINLYYSSMVLVPVLFIFASGSTGAYASMFYSMYSRVSWRTVVAAIGTLVFGFVIQNVVFFLILRHAELDVWHSGTTWQDPGNIVFMCVNPAMETFFWRVFMHRELAVRWFPSKSQSDEQLPLSLSSGTTILPQLSMFGMMLNGAAFSLYHYVPIVIYDLPIYAHAGMTYHMALAFLSWLVVFGTLAIYMRERLGIMSAWTLHVGVDLADVLMYTYIMMKAYGHPSAQLFVSWEF
jgi:hypothetical protein